jgi:hypothetical protein
LVPTKIPTNVPAAYEPPRTVKNNKPRIFNVLSIDGEHQRIKENIDVVPRGGIEPPTP